MHKLFIALNATRSNQVNHLYLLKSYGRCPTLTSRIQFLTLPAISGICYLAIAYPKSLLHSFQFTQLTLGSYRSTISITLHSISNSSFCHESPSLTILLTDHRLQRKESLLELDLELKFSGSQLIDITKSTMMRTYFQNV